jgi:CHAD domain-containing protein
MLQLPNTSIRIALRSKTPKAEGHSRPNRRLNAAMSCDAAFRIIARRHLADLSACQEETCKGDPTALHQMRAALTHLRAAIRFFSPMVTDDAKPRIWNELRWLNGALGAVRDLDVATEQIEAVKPERPRAVPRLVSWQEKRARSHDQLAHTLQSGRFKRLITHTSAWITGGPWCSMAGRRAAERRAFPVSAYGARKLAQWEKKLLRKRLKLRGMNAKKRHRLRLLNKRVTCSIESLADLLEDKELSNQHAALKPLRKAQRCLGRLNDEANGKALSRSLRKSGVAVPLHVLGPKREKRLLRTAEEAYRKLARLRLS